MSRFAPVEVAQYEVPVVSVVDIADSFPGSQTFWMFPRNTPKRVHYVVVVSVDKLYYVILLSN